ncbi:MAG: heparinase II/III family protein [Acidobacteriota bacterium]|nr:heparinase II/III family protein [Acidobacteriota bacterium]
MKSVVYGSIVLGALLAAGNPAQSQSAGVPQHLPEAATAQRETEVLNALDLSRPELSFVAAAWKKQDLDGAVKALAAYLRARDTVHWGTVPSGRAGVSMQQIKTIADDALVGKLQGGQTPYFYTFANADVDWHYNATFHMPGVPPDNEWQWQLNRMGVWGALGSVYQATHEESYTKAFDREMLSWVAQCPAPDHAANEPGSAWRTIEAGIRMGGSWPQAFFAFRRSPSISDSDLVVFLGAFLDHGRYLLKEHTRLNWLTMEMSGLYAVGALFPEFKEAAEWRNYGATTLAEEARKQFLPDGAQDELSTEYQNVALGNILKIPEIARWTGRLGELPKGYTAPLEKGYEYQVAIMAPDRYNPKYNNGLPQYLPRIFRMAVENFPDRGEFKWVESDGKVGKPPAFTSIFLNRAGEAAMRTDWSRQANYLGFRLGPIGMGHQHQAKLEVVVWAYGRPMIFNSGGGSYERSKWRSYATSSFGANCMIVDGMGQNRPTFSNDPWHDPDLISQGPIDGHWQTNTVFDFASGEYNGGYGPQRLRPASQQRDVLFLKPNMFVVADRVRPNDSSSHKYEDRWQLQTTHWEINRVTHALETDDEGLPNLVVVPLVSKGLEVRAVSGQESPELLGWDVRKDMDPENVAATTLLHTRTGTGPQLLLTLMVALKPGESNPVAGVTPGADGRSATVTLMDGRKLLISAPGELGITVEETLPDGKPGRTVKGGAA